MGDQTDKTSRWAFTAYADQYHLFNNVMPDVIAEIGYQKEICPDTQREHYQGYIRTSRQVRFAQLRKIFPGVHLEAARNWDALLEYCKKKESAVPGTQVHIGNETERPKQLTMSQALIFFASHYPYGETRPDFSEMTGQQLTDYKKAEFWRIVNNCIDTDANLIGVYHQPQYIRCWEHTSSKWLERCLESAEWAETDRQTDTLSGYAFEK